MMRSPYVATSFFIDDPEVTLAVESAWKQREQNSGRTLASDSNLHLSLPLSGSICLYDVTKLHAGPVLEFKINNITGMFFCSTKKRFYLAQGNKLLVYCGGKCEVIQHNLFNDLHGISEYDDFHILIASTGTDSILIVEKSPPYGVKRYWLATENGYSRNTLGDVVTIDVGKNYSLEKTFTPQHATHLNSAIFDDGCILSTFFHQGELVRITSDSVEVILSDLNKPHSIRKNSNFYTLADSANNQFFVLNSRLQKISVVREKFNWVQDVLMLGLNRFLVADSNNHCIKIVDADGKVLDQHDFGLKKIFSFESISKIDFTTSFGL